MANAVVETPPLLIPWNLATQRFRARNRWLLLKVLADLAWFFFLLITWRVLVLFCAAFISTFVTRSASTWLQEEKTGLQSSAMRQLKIIVEKHADGCVAYPVGIKGSVVGEGDTYEEALADVRSAMAFHVETFGRDVLGRRSGLEG